MRLTPALLLLASLLLGACGGKDDVVKCFTVWIPAIKITVVDARGAAVEDARVTFRRNEGAEEAATCSEPTQAPGGCVTWEAKNQAGSYIVRATSADGQRAVQEEVLVTSSECGPDATTELQLVLPD